jgi:hypothetical protein
MAVLLGLSCFALAPTIYNAVATIASKSGNNNNEITSGQDATADTPVNRIIEFANTIPGVINPVDFDNLQLPDNNRYGKNFAGDPELLDYLLGKAELNGMSRPGYPDIESPFQSEFASIPGLSEFLISTDSKDSNPQEKGKSSPGFAVSDLNSDFVDEFAPLIGTGMFALAKPGNSGSGNSNLPLNTATDTGYSTASVSPVPLPAAAWLFGSALFAFFGISRRKAAATV